MARFTCPNCAARLHAATDVVEGSIIVEREPEITVGERGLCGPEFVTTSVIGD
jgi:hypothetical protein